MIAPHGSAELNPLYVEDEQQRAALETRAEGLESVVVGSAAAANAVMLGGGYFNPLSGFMDVSEALSVAHDMQTPDGLFWPVPVLCLVGNAVSVAAGSTVALRDPNVENNPVLAIMEVVKVETLSDEQMQSICQG